MNRLRHVLVWAAALPAIWALLGGAFSGYRLKRAEQAWADAGDSLEGVLARNPAAAANAAALRVDAAALELGLRPLSRQASDQERAASSAAFPPWLRMRLEAFLKGLATRREDGAAPPSREVLQLLDLRPAPLAALERELARGGVVWAIDIAQGPRSPLPALAAQRDLHQLLLAHALAEAHLGRSGAARAALEASWELSRALARRPELMSQIIALSIAELQMGVLRQIPDPPREWRERLAAVDYKGPMLASYATYALGTARYVQEPDAAGDDPGLTPLQRHRAVQWVQHQLTRPYLWFATASFVERLALLTARLRESDLCAAGEPIRKAAGDDWLPGVTLTGLTRMWTTVRFASLDAERTALILAARAERRQTGAWPAAAVRPSAVCRGVSWRHVVGEDGGLRILPEPDPFPSWRSGRLEFTLRPGHDRSVYRPVDPKPPSPRRVASRAPAGV